LAGVGECAPLKPPVEVALSVADQPAHLDHGQVIAAGQCPRRQRGRAYPDVLRGLRARQQGVTNGNGCGRHLLCSVLGDDTQSTRIMLTRFSWRPRGQDSRCGVFRTFADFCGVVLRSCADSGRSRPFRQVVRMDTIGFAVQLHISDGLTIQASLQRVLGAIKHATEFFGCDQTGLPPSLRRVPVSDSMSRTVIIGSPLKGASSGGTTRVRSPM